VFLDDFSDQDNRNLHMIVSNVRLNEVTNQIIKAGSNPYAEFELQPLLK